MGILAGRSAGELAEELDAARSSIYCWRDRYIALGLEGLRTEVSPGRPRRLLPEQEEELCRLIEDGPMNAGYSTGIWTGPMIAELVRKRMSVHYHHRYIPRLLHRLGFSVQRPRKRLAKADAEAQAYWLRTKLPAIKKRPGVAVES
ncbi:MAG: helix-turn-helix domain-containing protein [Gammaproteobacteria bacterium]|nr:helix-turn-helix domain-containing protein [Gammaproteobacteria bacterium]